VEPARRALECLVERVEIFPLPRLGSMSSTLLALLSGRPLTVGYFAHGGLERRIRQLDGEGGFDVVLASCSSMAAYAMAVRAPRVVDLVDADSAKWAAYARFTAPPRRWLYALEARRLRVYEKLLAHRFGRILVTTEREARWLDADGGPVEVVPNGIDCESWSPGGSALADRPPTVVFTGQMDYYPNVDAATWFARRVVPQLAARIADVRFVIVGRRPVEAVRRLKSQAAVTVTGEVPDVRPYLERATVFVAPLRIARGVQNKVLEAMACGVPVVMSSEVASGLEGVSLVAGDDYLVADTAESFRDAVGRLLQERDVAQRMAASARDRVERHCGWDLALDRLETVLEQVAMGGANAARLAGREASVGLAAWEREEVVGADP
jgi:sugar transferase (PEP-CTERM/EpsH1 system associated)